MLSQQTIANEHVTSNRNDIRLYVYIIDIQICTAGKNTGVGYTRDVSSKGFSTRAE